MVQKAMYFGFFLGLFAFLGLKKAFYRLKWFLAYGGSNENKGRKLSQLKN
jgi:hypothetical protein